MTQIRLLTALLALCLVTACASRAPGITRYVLPGANVDSSIDDSQAAGMLVVRPLVVASFLDNDGIVLQLDDITLNNAANHRWAENLGRQLQRGLRQGLAARLPDTRIIDDTAGPRDAPQLRVEVDRFQGRHDGQAVASGQWQLRAADGAIITQRNFLVQVPLEDDGYPALVRALGRCWDQVAEQIANFL